MTSRTCQRRRSRRPRASPAGSPTPGGGRWAELHVARGRPRGRRRRPRRCVSSSRWAPAGRASAISARSVVAARPAIAARVRAARASGRTPGWRPACGRRRPAAAGRRAARRRSCAARLLPSSASRRRCEASWRGTWRGDALQPAQRRRPPARQRRVAGDARRSRQRAVLVDRHARVGRTCRSARRGRRSGRRRSASAITTGSPASSTSSHGVPCERRQTAGNTSPCSRAAACAVGVHQEHARPRRAARPAPRARRGRRSARRRSCRRRAAGGRGERAWRAQRVPIARAFRRAVFAAGGGPWR